MQCPQQSGLRAGCDGQLTLPGGNQDDARFRRQTDHLDFPLPFDPPQSELDAVAPDARAEDPSAPRRRHPAGSAGDPIPPTDQERHHVQFVADDLDVQREGMKGDEDDVAEHGQTRDDHRDPYLSRSLDPHDEGDLRDDKADPQPEEDAGRVSCETDADRAA